MRSRFRLECQAVLDCWTQTEMETDSGNSLDKFHSYFDELLRLSQNEHVACESTVSIDATKSWLDLAGEKAAEGSTTATSLLCAHDLRQKASGLLLAGQDSESLRLLRESSRLYKLPQDGQVFAEFAKAADRLLQANPSHPEALYFLSANNWRTAPEDQLDDEELLQVSLSCIESCPDEADFHHNLSCVYRLLRYFNQARRSCLRSLQISENVSRLYDLATYLRLELNSSPEVQPSQVIAAYQDFLDKCPGDHSRVPEAYYSIGFIHNLIENSEKAQHYLQKATKAEETRLQCFPLVPDNFPPKFSLRTVFELRSAAPSSAEPRNQTFCHNCRRSGIDYRRCSSCKQVRYCSKNCQRAHWKSHKVHCTS